MRWSLAVVLVATVTATLAPAAPVAAQATAGPQIVAVYPNPAYEDDRGEFVVLEIPEGTTGNLSLSDGETVVTLPDRRPSGRVAVATEPVVRNLTEPPVVLVPGPFRLANSGETVTLRVAGEAVHSVTYARAPEGSIYRSGPDGWHWQRLGATSFPVRTAEDARARLFVLPDAPEAALEPPPDRPAPALAGGLHAHLGRRGRRAL